MPLPPDAEMPDPPDVAGTRGHTDDAAKLSLHAETVSVSRRRVETAVVRVESTTGTRTVLVEEELAHEGVEVTRVPIGRIIEAVPPVREEGDTTVLPVVEEVLVVERRLVLREEVHLRRVRTTQVHSEVVTLRGQTASITRTSPSPRPDGTPPPPGTCPPVHSQHQDDEP